MMFSPPQFHPRISRLFWNASWRALRCLAALALVVPFTGTAQEISVHLKNGDRLTGTNVVQEAETISLETALGKITIPRNLIEHTEPELVNITTDSAPQPPEKSAATKESLAQQYLELKAQYESGKITAAQYHARRAVVLEQWYAAGYAIADLKSPAPPPKPAAKQTASAAAKPSSEGGSRPTVKGQFHGEARLGTDLLFGTKDQQIYTAKLKGVHTWGRLKNSADYLFTYGRADGDLSANRMDGSLKSDWQLTDRFYTYNLGGAGYDEIRKVDLRYEMGPGIGYQFFKKKGFVLSGEFGMHYQVEERRTSKDKKKFYYRFADIASWTITPKLSLDQKIEWLPQVEDIYVYQVRAETNIRYKLAENLSLVLTFIDRYHTDPGQNVDHNDLQVRSSVGVSF